MEFIRNSMKNKKIVGIAVCALLFVVLMLSFNSLNSSYSLSLETIAMKTAESKDYVYLSDLEFITDNNWSYNGWSGHEIQVDKNQDAGSLSLIVDGETRTYAKGVGLHAKGQVTYDISALSTDYPRFTAKIGVDATRLTNGSIWFQIYVSNDGETWTSLLKTDIMTGVTEAVDVDLDVEGYKYLRIYVDPNGSNAADHGTIANAKLVTKDYVNTDIFYDKIHKLEYYDEILRAHDAEYNYENNYRLILEREFVNKIGYWSIQNLAEFTPGIVDTLDWILSDNENLEQLIEAGEVLSGLNYLSNINLIYSQYKDEFKTENGYVYQKMMFGLVAGYGTDRVASPLTFSTRVGTFDVLERFTLMKKLFDDGAFLRTEEFKTYNVQLMRYVMQDAYRAEETLWLNALSKTKSNPLNHYAYIGYRLGPNYSGAAFRDPANKETYDTKYMLSQYNVPYGDNVIRYWMAMEYGGVCWNISRIGQSVYRVNGIPAVGIYQPQHEAYLGYVQDENGVGTWGAYYNIFGWGKSCTRWYGGNPYRMLFNWGEKYFTDKAISTSTAGYNAGYMILGQAGLNQKEPFFKSFYLNYLANSYTDDEDKIEVYNKALESSNINLDSYDYIITLYKNMNKTSSEWHDLALRIIDAYTYYPMAMYDLLKVIKPYLQGADRVDIDLREYDALVLSSKSTDNEVLQSSGLKQIASVLLGKTNAQLATFSFDGENAGKIVIDSTYADFDFNLYYSLDNGETFSEKTTSHVIQLPPEDLARITEDNDIKIYMDGTPQVYTINIEKAVLPETLYGNDLENRVIGVNLTYEWRNSENDAWTSYATASPDNTGNKTLHVRVGATGIYLPSDSRTFTFTEDNQPNERKYVPVSHLSIEAYSTQSIDTARPYYAPNAIDGNIYTLWHTDFRENVITKGEKPYIVIKLDKLRYVSAIEFRQTKYKADDPDYIKNAKIFISDDNENWIEAGAIENCPQDLELRNITFSESVEGQYIKIELETYSMFASLSMVNVFQDMTKNPRPTAGVGYSTTEPTKENVVARLVNVSAEHYEILSEGGDTHIFTENGEFTFRFKDTDTGVEGTSLAKVDWIDRTPPTATIEYSTTSPTNSTVVATLKPSEDVIITNNGDYEVDEDGIIRDHDGNILSGYTVDDDGNVKDAAGNIIININKFTYDFIANGEFVFEFEDKAGNRGSATAKVDWIDTEAPVATLTYDKNTLTNQNVTVTIDFDEEAVVTNNGGSRTYTFTNNGEFTFAYSDLAGNAGVITAKVNWIDKEAPTAELKYERVGEKVVVRVVNPSKEITFQEGIGVYEFTRNGTYEIVFYDKAGNVGKLTAVIKEFEDAGDINQPVTPDNPTTPSNPSNPGTISPGTSGNTGGNNNQTTNPGGNNSGNSTGGDTVVEPINKEYEKYSIRNVVVEIPKNELKEGYTVNAPSFNIPSSMDVKFGEDSEYYDIYVLDENGARVDIATESPIKITISLKKTKRFLGVYEITEDNKVRLVEYERNGDNIEILGNKLGKYVVSYKELEVVNPEITIPVVKEKENDIIMPVILGLVSAVIVGTTVYASKKKKEK